MSQAGIVDIEGSHPQIPTLFVCDVGSAIPIANTIEILGSAVAAHSVPLQTVGSGNTINIDIQYSSAAASSVATNAGVSSFNSTQFTVDANGFVSFSGSGGAETLTGNSGGAVSPTANNINTIGTGSITIVGNPGTSTLTTQLTGLTNHAIQIGAGTATLTQLGAGTTGQVLQTNTGADPTWSTATYPSTTTINQILYSSSANVVGGITAGNNGVLISGTTGIPSWLADGTTGQVLTATTGSPPSWVSPATSGTVTSVSVVTANGFAGTVATATTTPAITLTTTITGVLSGNGTAVSGSAITQHDVLVGGASNAITSVSPSTAGFVLTSNGVGADPTFQAASASGALTNLSDDVGASITPSSGNIQLVGHVVEQGATKFSTVVAGTHLANINPMSPARWIVDPLGFNGTHTTISSAITSATAGDTILILPGTYTENPTLKAGVNLVAFEADSLTPNVIINGNCTFTGVGTVSISGINLQTNSAPFLTVSGSSASVVNLKNCYLNCLNNTGISYSSSSGSSEIIVDNCQGNIATTGIAIYSMSSSGGIVFKYCYILNSGASTTASSNSAGTVLWYYSTLTFPLGSTSTGSGFLFYVNQNSSGTSSLTTAGTGTWTITDSSLAGGTASALNIGSGTSVISYSTILSSSNTNLVTGAGSYTYIDNTSTTNTTMNPTTIAGATILGGMGAPPVGFIGEYLIDYETAVSITNGGANTVASISITPGIWDVSGCIQYIATVAASATQISIGITPNNLTGQLGTSYGYNLLTGATMTGQWMSLPAARVLVSSTTTYYLCGSANFAAGTVSADGRISATRVG